MAARYDHAGVGDTARERLRRQIIQPRRFDARVADTAEAFEHRRKSLFCLFTQRIQLNGNTCRHFTIPRLFYPAPTMSQASTQCNTTGALQRGAWYSPDVKTGIQ